MTASDWSVLRPLITAIDGEVITSSPHKMACDHSEAFPTVDVDCDGWPVFGAPHVEVASTDCSCLPAADVEFDSDGWPVFGTSWKPLSDGRLASATTDQPVRVCVQPSASSPEPVPVPTPNQRVRKSRTLSNRREYLAPRQKEDTAAPVKGKEFNVEPSTAVVHHEQHADDEPDVAELPFIKVYVSCTREDNPRFEVTAHVLAKGARKRIFLFTLYKKSWGDTFHEDGMKLVELCKQPGCNQRLAREHKALLNKA